MLDVLVQPPSEAQLPNTHYCKLHVAAYGLSNAAHERYQTLINRLCVNQINECLPQHCSFSGRNETGECIGLLIVDVDDILFGGTTEFEYRDTMLVQDFVWEYVNGGRR